MDIQTYRTQKRIIEQEIKAKLDNLSEECGLKLDIHVEAIPKYSIGKEEIIYKHEIFIKAEM
jgi:hypothetical protein